MSFFGYTENYLTVLKQIRDNLLSSGIGGSTGNITLNLEGIETVKGTNGLNGLDGSNGLSAYQIWLELGNIGSEQDFLNSFSGSENIHLIDITSDLITDGCYFHMSNLNVGDIYRVTNKIKGLDVRVFLDDLLSLSTLKNNGDGSDFLLNNEYNSLYDFNGVYDNNNYCIFKVLKDGYFVVLDYKQYVLWHIRGSNNIDYYLNNYIDGSCFGRMYVYSTDLTLLKTVNGVRYYKLTNKIPLPYPIDSLTFASVTDDLIDIKYLYDNGLNFQIKSLVDLIDVTFWVHNH